MNKRFLAMILVIVLAVTAACGGGGTPDRGDAVVYVAVPLSGFQANGGQTVLGGARLAAEEINRKGGLRGYRVVVRPLDDESSDDVAVARVGDIQSALDGGETVLGVIGHLNSGQTLAAMDLYKDMPLLVVTPTRAGLWSQIDRSPFYQGHPYSAGQLAGLLRANMFAPMQQTRALFMPPTHSRLALRMAPTVERFGRRWLGRFAGVSVIEAGKQLYAGIAERNQSAERAVVRPKLRIASSRDTQAARNSGDGEAPAS